MELARKPKLVRVADYIALLICVSVFVSMLPGFGEVLLYASILFYLAIPGYAFTRAFFAHMLSDERFLALIAFSIAISSFVKVLIEVFLGRTVVPSTVILNFISIAMLGLAIIRDRGLHI